jgi:hypothetical protein
VTNHALARARAGDEDALRELTDRYGMSFRCTSTGWSGRPRPPWTYSKKRRSWQGLALPGEAAVIRLPCSLLRLLRTPIPVILRTPIPVSYTLVIPGTTLSAPGSSAPGSSPMGGSRNTWRAATNACADPPRPPGEAAIIRCEIDATAHAAEVAPIVVELRRRRPRG